MTFAAPEPRPVRIDGDQGHQDQVRVDLRCTRLGLKNPERSRDRRIGGDESKGLCWIVEGREGDDSADRARFLDRQERADFASHGRIAGDDTGRCAERGQMLGKLLLEQSAAGIVKRANERLASLERGASKRLF